MISVVIPLYNKEQLIAKTLRSVLAQSYTDYEVIVVDDGSTDGSAAAVRALGDPRITLLSQPNAGVSAARNRGIRAARGEWIALLDADDLWLPDYLATQVALAEKYPAAQVCATDYLFRDEHGLTTPTRINRLPFTGPDGILSNYFEVASCSHPPIWTSAIMARRSALLAVGAFPEGVTSGEDLLTWARLACRYPIAYTTHAAAVYYTPTTGPTGIVPVDLKSTNDVVGNTLVGLSRQFPKSGIKIYVSFWYKMRGVINIRRRNRLAALKCACKSLKYKPNNYKAMVIACLTIMPSCIIDKIMAR